MNVSNEREVLAMMKRFYNLINTETAEIVAYTCVYDCDNDDKEVLDCRLESAIIENLIPDESYIWEVTRDNACFGILI